MGPHLAVLVDHRCDDHRVSRVVARMYRRCAVDGLQCNPPHDARRSVTPSIPLSAVPAAATIRLTFPMPRNIGNGAHGHWATRNAQRVAYLKALDTLQACGKIPAPPKKPFDRVRVDSIMHLANQMDVDNALRRHKWILDFLKTRGYIVDDSPKHLEWVSFPEQHVKRDGNYRVELSITPIF